MSTVKRLVQAFSKLLGDRARMLELGDSEIGMVYQKKTIGKPQENHRETTGKSWEHDGLMGFDGKIGYKTPMTGVYDSKVAG